MLDSIKDSLGELLGMTVVVCICAVPAYVALRRMSFRSKYGIDWGPRRNVLAIALATSLVLALIFLFSKVYSSANTWTDWWD